MHSTSSCAVSRPRTTRRAATAARTSCRDPDEVYRALLTVILRLVFLLYAEERDMLPRGRAFLRYYSLAGLYERLREDAARYPTRWTSGSVRGHSCSRCSGWFTTGPVPGDVAARRVTACSSTPTASRSSRVADGGGRQIHERIDPPLFPMAPSIARSRSFSCSTASGSRTGRSTSSRSARSTRR